MNVNTESSVGCTPVVDSLILPDIIRLVGMEKTIERLRSPDLKNIAVNDCFSLDDFDFLPLSVHERLEGLSFFGMRDCFSSIDKILKHIRRLDALSITYASPIDNRTIRIIASINGLTRLKLWNPVNNVNGVDWSPLGNCESLGDIDIQGARLRTINLTFAGSLPDLTRLSLMNNQLRRVDLGPLSQCGRLAELNLSHNGFDEGISLEPLSQCTSFKSLGLSGTHLTEIDMSPLAESDLVMLSLAGGRIRSIDLSPLAKCRNLESIGLNNQRIARIDLSPLAKCRKLKALGLDGNRLPKIDLSPLADCVNLEILDLGGNRLKSIDLSPLSSCPSLRELLLGGNRLTGVDLSPLEQCPSLQLVDLRGNVVRKVDAGPVRNAEVRLA